MNVSYAHHHAGSWEIMNRSIRNVMNVVLTNHSKQLNDDCLLTFMAEAEAVINSRPITVDNLHDPMSPMPLSPIQLLTMKTNVVLPPPGIFERPDIFSRKLWRRVQYVSNEFWHRWKREYVSILQSRNRWCRSEINLRVGDVVLLKDDMIPRNLWKLAVVSATCPSSDSLIRKARIRVSVGLNKPNKEYDRPISELIFLMSPNGVGN